MMRKFGLCVGALVALAFMALIAIPSAMIPAMAHDHGKKKDANCACNEPAATEGDLDLTVTMCYTPVLAEFDGPCDVKVDVYDPKTKKVIDNINVNGDFLKIAEQNGCGKIRNEYTICMGDDGNWYKYASTMDAQNRHKERDSAASLMIEQGKKITIPDLKGVLDFPDVFKVTDKTSKDGVDIWCGEGEAAREACEPYANKVHTIHILDN